MEAPPPNDSLKASLSPLVGGRLHSSQRLANKQMFNMVNIITNGYVLSFMSRPNSKSGYTALQKDQSLATCIKSLLSKNTVERVDNVKRLPSHAHQPKLKEIPKILPQVSGVPVHLSSIRSGHSPQVLQ